LAKARANKQTKNRLGKEQGLINKRKAELAKPRAIKQI